jgi:hypothetical protein
MAPAIATDQPVDMGSDFRRSGQWAFRATASQNRVSDVCGQRVNSLSGSFLVPRLDFLAPVLLIPGAALPLAFLSLDHRKEF